MAVAVVLVRGRLGRDWIGFGEEAVAVFRGKRETLDCDVEFMGVAGQMRLTQLQSERFSTRQFADGV